MQYIDNFDYLHQYDLSFIDLKKVYKIKQNDKEEEYTLLERCLFEKRYKYILNYCHKKLKSTYKQKDFLPFYEQKGFETYYKQNDI